MDVTVHIICSICVLACCPWAIGLNLAHNGIKFVMKKHSWRIPKTAAFSTRIPTRLFENYHHCHLLFKQVEKQASDRKLYQKNSTRNLTEFYWDKLIASELFYVDIFQFKLKKYPVEMLMHKKRADSENISNHYVSIVASSMCCFGFVSILEMCINFSDSIGSGRQKS